MHEAEFQKILKCYFKYGSPEKAIESLDWLTSTRELDPYEATDFDISPYYFARIAEDNPDIIRAYEDVFSNALTDGRNYVLAILGLVGDQDTIKFLNKCTLEKSYKDLLRPIAGVLADLPSRKKEPILSRNIEHGFDMDLHWIEYSVTGNTDAVVKIIAVLDRPEILRHEIEKCLRTAGESADWTKDQGQELVRDLKEYNIYCDGNGQRVLNKDDLDISVAMNNDICSVEQFQNFLEVFPVTLLPKDKTAIAIKEVARWSLDSFAREDETVLGICEEELSRLSARAKSSLLDVVAWAHLAHGDLSTAVERFKQLEEIEPTNPRIKAALEGFDQPDPTRIVSRNPESVKTFSEVPPDLPSKAVIERVPFVGFEEADTWDYPDKGTMSPSPVASHAMIGIYWGEDLETAIDAKFPPEDWIDEWGQAESLDVIKPYLCSGRPVVVGPSALTPYAHPIIYQYAEMTGHEFENRGPISGALGRMLPLDLFEKAKWHTSKRIIGAHLAETVYISYRVVIGFDDQRKIVTLNDPTFGPNWELSYEEFENLWGAGDRLFSVIYPGDFKERLLESSKVSDIEQRTPDDEAAVDLAFGYALSSAGRVAEGEARLRRGLRRPGISDGFSFLLSYELAIHCFATGRNDEAIKFAENAANLIPNRSAPWEVLGYLFERKYPKHPGLKGYSKYLCNRLFSNGWESKAFKAYSLAKKYSRNEYSAQIPERHSRRFVFGDFLYGARLVRYGRPPSIF